MTWLRRLIGALMMCSALALALSRAPDRPVESLVAKWAAPPSQFIQIKGQLVHLRDEGLAHDPRPLVLIHGTSASLHTWEGWAKALRGGRRVISVDLPGFGLSGANAMADYRSDTDARFVLELMDHLGVRLFSIAGNSLGGEVAWRVAARAPERVHSLILVDAGGYAFEPQEVPWGFQLARTPILNRLSEWMLPRAVVERSVRQVYGDPGKVTSELIDRHFELTLREGNRRALVQRLAQAEPGADALLIKKLRLPTLVMWGGRDRLIPVHWASRFVADIPSSQLVVFDHLGHVPQEEDPALTVQAVKTFLGT